VGTLRRAVLLGLLGTFALCAVGPLLQWAAGQALQVVAAGLADGLRLAGIALVVLAGGGAVVLVVGVRGWAAAQRDRAAGELWAARQPGALPPVPPDDVIDGVFTVQRERPMDPARRLPPGNAR
jgi:hypothetical protein